MIWTQKDADNHAAYLAGETGRKFIEKLRAMRPPPACNPIEHQAVYQLGAIAGHEQAQVDILKLSISPAPPKKDVLPTYGVPDRVEKATPA